jgi:hypothetical protein
MLCREPAAAMAKYLLHGTLFVTIYGGKHIVTERRTANAPAFFRKVSSIFLYCPNSAATRSHAAVECPKWW